jgi:phospholipid/cholesterol/gamma-HCH transport system ATP-binding protein
VAGDVIIRVENVDAGYEGVALLRDIEFEIRRGEVFGILGGSGCGKSTLMKHMIGLNPPIRGSIRIDGDDIVTAEGEQLERVQRKFGAMYQSGALFGSMTLLENVRLPLEIYTDLPDDAVDLVARMKLELVGPIRSRTHAAAVRRHAEAPASRAMALIRPCFSTSRRPSRPDHGGIARRHDPAPVRGLSVRSCRDARRVHATDRVILLDRGAKGIIAEGDPRRLRDETTDPRVRAFFRREAEAVAT